MTFNKSTQKRNNMTVSSQKTQDVEIPSELILEATFETLNLYKEAGYDPFSRTIYIWGEINPEMSYHFVSSINSLIKLNSTAEPITLFLNSPGGNIYDLFQMIDYMNFIYDKYKIKINVYGGGQIMSAAAFLLIASTGIRCVFKNSVILLHEIQSYSGFDNTSRKKDDLDHIINLETQIIEIISQRTKKKSLGFWQKEIAYKDKIYLPTDALKLGMIDNIV